MKQYSREWWALGVLGGAAIIAVALVVAFVIHELLVGLL